MKVLDQSYTWQSIETAPDLERVLVCGLQPKHGNVRAYWWYGEDVVSDGRAIGHPKATHWAPLVLPGRFPDEAPHAAETGISQDMMEALR